MLSVKQGRTKYHFWVFGMARLGIEPWSSGPLANTLLIRPMASGILEAHKLNQTEIKGKVSNELLRKTRKQF